MLKGRTVMQDQKQVVEALLKSEAYPEAPGKIELIQTHISFVFLTQDYVYKVKKAVNFGFLDFSTLDKRRLFCKKELELNRRLCPEIYLSVVPINKSDQLKIDGEGETVEYALKMKRLPQERIMTVLLEEGKVDKKTIDEIAQIVAQFHSKAQTNAESQTAKYIDQIIAKNDWELIKAKIDSFMDKEKALFESRIAGNRIRDCHGDLHSGNIFITDKICIFDAIEFNDRFRYSDVAADVAFLAMDLDYQKRPDLANHFIKKFLEYSNDKQLTQMLAFYKCYRAYVRGNTQKTFST
jgi:aminoglycoside phosphotransferase family enzyme